MNPTSRVLIPKFLSFRFRALRASIRFWIFRDFGMGFEVRMVGLTSLIEGVEADPEIFFGQVWTRSSYTWLTLDLDYFSI